MARKVRSIFLYITGTILFFGSMYYNLDRNSVSDDQFLRLAPLPLTSIPTVNYNQLVHEEQHLNINQTTSNPSLSSPSNTISTSSSPPSSPFLPSQSPSLPDSTSTPSSLPQLAPRLIPSLAILLPAWQVLVVNSPGNIQLKPDSGDFVCLFPNKETSPAFPSGILPSPDRATFTCELPTRTRRRLPFPQPVLVKSPVDIYPTPAPDLLRWDLLVYDVLFTENDVVVFVKGMNKRQGINRAPQEFNCVFGDDVVKGVRTAITSSSQEVFRCQRPDLTAVSPSSSSSLFKVSLEFTTDKKVIPSVAYGTPARKVTTKEPTSLLCSCTMVYNVAKFLKEWVIYHSKIGVDKFILYDNGSDDDLNKVVEELIKEGFFVSTKFWLWPKTQEAGFSHCAISAKDSCTWMMYMDVDEFVYSDLWSNSSTPSKSMLQSILPNLSSNNNISEPSPETEPNVGEIMISCHEFGPSNQKIHPIMGVMQGYNCRKQMENRHKSIVLLDAINESLLNVIHHFDLKEGYKMEKMSVETVVVNHYKYQAWPEFKAKFRRRVSAYVVDWTQTVNPDSNDRTPGLGFSAVEPEGWPEKFCEVRDNGLKELSEKWFGVESISGYQMA